MSKPPRRLIGTVGDSKPYGASVWADDLVDVCGAAPFGGPAFAVRLRPDDVDEFVTLLLRAKRYARSSTAFEDEPDTIAATPTSRLAALSAGDVCRICGHGRGAHVYRAFAPPGETGPGRCTSCDCKKFEP